LNASHLGVVAKTKREEVLDMEKATAAGEVDLANALDLSESEEEEELEDIIEDFSRAEAMEVSMFTP
jgi:hypothetical protein